MELEKCGRCTQEYIPEDKIHCPVLHRHNNKAANRAGKRTDLRSESVKPHQTLFFFLFITACRPKAYGVPHQTQGAMRKRENRLSNTSNYFDAWTLASPRYHGNRALSVRYDLEFGGCDIRGTHTTVTGCVACNLTA